jgi:hypothetical protein
MRGKKVKQLRHLPPWTPFEQGVYNTSQTDAIVSDMVARGVPPQEARAAVQNTLSRPVMINSRYQVSGSLLKAEGFPDVIHLSIKRRDKAPISEERFRDFQRIKNELIGPEYTAVEIYPPERDLVDTSNQHHLWVFNDPNYELPFALKGRLVVEKPIVGGKQRPFED